MLVVAGIPCAYAQTYIGQHETINYEKKQYNAGTQNWKIKQDAEGRIYVANNEGVLAFDGSTWQLYPLPNKTIVWSIEFGRDGNLYAGGQDEFGYFSPAPNGRLVFTSLKNLLPKSRQKFSDIWDVVNVGNDVFFRSRDNIFKYSDHKITVYPASSSWLFMGMHQNRLIAHDERNGLMVYNHGKWETLVGRASLPNGFYVTGIAAADSGASLITTAKNGVYILRGNKLSLWTLSGFGIDNHEHFSACLALKDGFLLGTYANGIYQTDRSGTVIENISKKDGLQNSNVRTMFLDANQNVWLGLDNGIDFIAYNNAVKHINPDAFKDGSGFSMTIFKDKLYFALSNGIYRYDISDSHDLSYCRNKSVQLSKGLSWNLSVVNDKLFAGNDDGGYLLENNKFIPLDRNTGYWLFKPLIDNKQAVAAGNYYGVNIFDFKAGKITPRGNIGTYKESSRFMEVENSNTIWTSHPYRGVYKLNAVTGRIKVYTEADGLPSTLDNFVFKIRGHVVIATQKGIYKYNDKTDRFIKDKQFQSVFENRPLRYLKEDASGNIWFVEGKSIGVADYSSGQPTITYFPELNRRILSGFESVFPYNDSNIFVGAENGFYHINYKRYKENIHPLKTYIQEIKIIGSGDSLLFGGYSSTVNNAFSRSAAALPSLSYGYNSLHFEYSSPVFEGQSNVEYSYLLEGYDQGWSTWSKKTEKDYTNLPAGNYTFKVKARNHFNNDSPVCTYAFKINPPWYQSLPAYACYLIAFVMLMWWLYRLQEKRHNQKREKELELQREKNEEEQKRLTYLHQLELERAEKEVVKLKNEKLEADIEFKNSELASAAMNLVQKKEFILKVKDELQRLQKQGTGMVEATEIKKILRLLSEEKKVNEEWEQFSIHFDKVHSDFLITLKDRYPAINQQELKLCAYLVMNLSSKEIAQLMAISVRGVEISRYRLRKKLQLPTEANLFEFLFEIKKSV